MLRRWLIKRLTEAESRGAHVVQTNTEQTASPKPAAASQVPSQPRLRTTDLPTLPRPLRTALVQPRSVCTSLKDLCEL